MKRVVANVEPYRWKVAELVLPGNEKVIIATDGDIIRIRSMRIQPLEIKPRLCADEHLPTPRYYITRDQ